MMIHCILNSVLGQFQGSDGCTVNYIIQKMMYVGILLRLHGVYAHDIMSLWLLAIILWEDCQLGDARP